MGYVGRLLRDPVLIVVVAGAALYATVANQYYLFLLTVGALTVIVGVGLNVLIGLTGQVSFGHVGFYALGAYATAILSAKYGWNFWWTLPVGAVLTGVVGALLGLVALVGPSRIQQGHHWFTDVTASYLLGTSYVVALAALYRRVKAHRARVQA